MSRLQRQIDQTDVLDRPTDHWPTRPGWTCHACHGAWPCAPLRGHLLATLDRSDIDAAMAGYYPMAEVELSEVESHVLHDRFFGWHRLSGWHPPGGVL